jgi:hypothetical protein
MILRPPDEGALVLLSQELFLYLGLEGVDGDFFVVGDGDRGFS